MLSFVYCFISNVIFRLPSGLISHVDGLHVFSILISLFVVRNNPIRHLQRRGCACKLLRMDVRILPQLSEFRHDSGYSR